MLACVALRSPACAHATSCVCGSRLSAMCLALHCKSRRQRDQPPTHGPCTPSNQPATQPIISKQLAGDKALGELGRGAPSSAWAGPWARGEVERDMLVRPAAAAAAARRRALCRSSFFRQLLQPSRHRRADGKGRGCQPAGLTCNDMHWERPSASQSLGAYDVPTGKGGLAGSHAVNEAGCPRACHNVALLSLAQLAWSTACAPGDASGCNAHPHQVAPTCGCRQTRPGRGSSGTADRSGRACPQRPVGVSRHGPGAHHRRMAVVWASLDAGSNWWRLHGWDVAAAAAVFPLLPRVKA